MPTHKSSEQREDKVDTPSIAYTSMASQNQWALTEDLLAGTQAMRDAGETWLKKEEKESRTNYDLRLSQSFLYNALADTLKNLAAKPFIRPVTLQGGELPERLQPIETNADHQGQDLTQFARNVFKGSIKRGLHHILVDFPTTGGLQTLAEEREGDIRPRFISIDASNLIGWRMAEGENAVPKLDQIRIREFSVEPEGAYIDKVVKRIRVINTDTFELWKFNEESKEYEKELDGAHTFDGIPLVTINLEPDGFMVASSPLLQLAWLNLAHWQSMSDQRNILRFSRVPILHGRGFTKEEAEGIEIGPNAIINSDSPEASLVFVEHTGAAIKTGEEDLKRLEERMEVLGSQPTSGKSTIVTATEKGIDEGRNMSTIQQWVRTLENGFEEAYGMAAKWVGVELPADFSVDVFSDFQVAIHTTEDATLLLKSCQASKISVETYLNELRRRGILSDMVDVKEEAERIRNLAPDLSAFMADEVDDEGNPVVDDDDDDDDDAGGDAE